MKKWILTTLFLLLSLNAVQADDGSSSLISGGASLAVTPHPSVRMVREEVKVQLYPDKALVHCKFIFKNDGKACSVKMGFPEEKQASGDTGKLFRMWGFKSWVDGTLVRTRRVQMVREHQNAYNSYQALYLKDVSFKSGQVRTVVDEYTTELGDMDWIFSPYCEYRLFTYVLKTGATWKGSIGKAVIKVDYSHLPFLYHVKPELAGAVRRGKSLIWILKNIEPKEDVSIILEKRGPKLNGKTIPGDSWSPYIVREDVLRSSPNFIHELCGTVKYLQDGVCFIQYGAHTLRLKSGSKVAILDGTKRINLPQPALSHLKEHQYSIPLQSLVKALNGKITIDKSTGKVFVEMQVVGKLDPNSAEPNLLTSDKFYEGEE